MSKEIKIDLITKQVKAEVIKTKTKIITEEPVIDTSQVKGKEKELEEYGNTDMFTKIMHRNSGEITELPDAVEIYKQMLSE